MNTYLMYKDQDFNLDQVLPDNADIFIKDLELRTLFNSMAQDDEFLFIVARKVILSSLFDPETIVYRQDILKDCLKNTSVIRELYQISIESIENKKKFWMGIFSRSPGSILYSAVRMMDMFVCLLKKLKAISDRYAEQFDSEGFIKLFNMINSELNDEYFEVVAAQLKELKFNNGILLSAQLGQGNEGFDYTMRKFPDNSNNFIKRLMDLKKPEYTFRLANRDDHGARALSEIRDRGINLAANALAQAADHIDSFLIRLQAELAFYIGCLNLREQLDQMDTPITFPIPLASEHRSHSFEDLYDICLALTKKKKVVGNSVDANKIDLAVIIGANQGGKSTFLRSIGLAQLMMQCGMYVPAKTFTANVCEGLFTHYKRKEDPSMNSGKLDEELSRMSDIANHLSANSMVLFNESFAATNEREGSEIARQIISALLEKHVKVFFVTHLYEFAHEFYNQKMANTIFLRAERKSGGRRTFKLREGEPLQTSFGKDVYNMVFSNGDS